ncbi:hypothetical protein [Rubrivivax gelatinosus]|uniref:hypothetical protein n=1 Tax=Rubrivivax gelatinosus TaxID=28068 RepID=UPI001905D386|nr:hypothetical protein [Rubrivivax gelatinosus]
MNTAMPTRAPCRHDEQDTSIVVLTAPAILDLRETPPFAAGLFWAIDCVCKHWVFVSTQSRLEVVIISRELAAMQADEP